ncbi:MAG TPA: protein kinase [Thiomicrospira sp.]|jgi:tRNA A-37 threonylcarbamoyl transferase component Bud32|nr:protein kinase [Thiomicrospira sp.]
MHNLEQLKSGELHGVTRLQISENLTEFPVEIFTLADSLEVLDLSGNQLSSLPDNLSNLINLKILFCSNNLFTEVPKALKSCLKLEMIGFKSNQITHFDENVLPLHTRWLILTDNQIAKLPDSIGELKRLQKCALAGNQLTEIPQSIKGCENLELLRIAANNLTGLPNELLSLPKLTWLAFSGNPFCQNAMTYCDSANTVSLEHIDLHEQIGEGASGLIHRAKWAECYATPKRAQGHVVEKNIAVKLYKGAVTSDGYPEDELAICLKAGEHPNLVKMLAVLQAEQQSGMVMGLIPKKFFNLGNPPSLKSCTRDTFEEGFSLPVTSVLNILIQVSDTVAHLHQKGICHGDLYAHNILINKKDSVLLGDFGAASCFSDLPKNQQTLAMQLEVKAFANLVEDLLSITEVSAMGNYLTNTLRSFVDYCREEQGLNFTEITEELVQLKENVM